MVDNSISTENKPPEFTLADVEAADYPTLRRMSIDAGLGGQGKKDAIRKSLIVMLTGTTKKHTHGRTKCKNCNAPCRVDGVKREPMSDGRTLVTRSMKCSGKHRHSFTLKEIEGQAVS